jgi:arsenite-transporting ATPase
VAGLSALNIDPEEAARQYRERVVGPYRHLLPAPTVARMEEQLSGACTTEIAAFDEFTRLLGADAVWTDCDHIVFDTAPTGHTLRLLNLPAAWDTFIDASTTGTSCLGPLSGLKAQHDQYKASLAALRDATRTTIVLVSRPDRTALLEAERTGAELQDIGITHQRLALNGLFRAADPTDAIAAALEERGRLALAGMAPALAALPRTEIPLFPWAPMGPEGLRRVLASGGTETVVPDATPAAWYHDGSVADLVRTFSAAANGVVLTMGKGGVGKTTIAAAVALELARQGHRVHLSTTDPAAHLDLTLGGETAGLSVSRIDPAVETATYRQDVLAGATNLDDQGRALIEEDLRSPCTEEIAVFRAFARTIAMGCDGFVVLDTAPTGHTLLLLDAAEAYHREVARTTSDVPDDVRQLLPRLRDRTFSRVLLVTLPEATPVHEAEQLQWDLRRAGIEPYAWIVNQSFACTPTRDPLLRQRAALERPYLEDVRDRHASRVAIVPWRPAPPVGRDQLLDLATSPLVLDTLNSSASC